MYFASTPSMRDGVRKMKEKKKKERGRGGERGGMEMEGEIYAHVFSLTLLAVTPTIVREF